MDSIYLTDKVISLTFVMMNFKNTFKYIKIMIEYGACSYTQDNKRWTDLEDYFPPFLNKIQKPIGHHVFW